MAFIEPRASGRYFGRAIYLKFACTVVFLEMTTSHVGAVPEQAPDQLTNFRPAAGVALKDTVVP